MLTLHAGGALIAMVLAKPFDDSAIGALRRWTPRAIVGRSEVAQCQGRHCARARPGRPDRKRLAGGRELVSGHELRAVWQAWKWLGFEAGPAEVKARFAMSIHKPVDIPRQPAHHTRSHSFASVLTPR